jgi:large subunit ribosomal protein L6
MSRIGKKSIAIPAGVTVTLDGQTVTVKGPKGQLAWTVSEEIEVKQDGQELTLAPRNDTTRAKGMWGLSRSLVGNMVQGVTQGYEQTLELVGVGYRAALKGQALSLQLGFSHDVDIPPPAGITFAVPKQTEVKIAASTSSWSAKSRPVSAASVRPSPTRARASATRAKPSVVRKARRSKPWRSLLAICPRSARSATGSGSRPCPTAALV